MDDWLHKCYPQRYNDTFESTSVIPNLSEWRKNLELVWIQASIKLHVQTNWVMQIIREWGQLRGNPYIRICGNVVQVHSLLIFHPWQNHRQPTTRVQFQCSNGRLLETAQPLHSLYPKHISPPESDNVLQMYTLVASIVVPVETKLRIQPHTDKFPQNYGYGLFMKPQRS